MVSHNVEALADALLAGWLPGGGTWELNQAWRAVEARLRNGLRPSDDGLCKAVKVFNDHRLFALGVEAGKAFLAFAGDNLRLRRLYCQALIDSGALDEAEKALSEAEGVINAPDSERLEIRGLRGRLAKQRYVVTAERWGTKEWKVLHQAIDHYLTAYEDDPGKPVWHGINAIALLRRAEMDDYPHPRSESADALAATILRRLCRKPLGVLDSWDVATIAELHLALDHPEEAELWLYRYATDPTVTPFQLGSTLRQIMEIWRLRSNTERWGRLVRILERAQFTRGSIKLPTAEALMPGQTTHDQAALEKVFGKESFLGYDSWLKALNSCAAVARVETAAAVGFGTGFLVLGSRLSSHLPDHPVLITNAHVISDQVPGALRPDQARIRFEVACRKDRSYVPLEVDRILCSSPPGDPGRPDKETLDFSIAVLKNLPNDAPALDVSDRLPRINSTSRAYVIGHPDGDGLQVSLHDSELLDYDDEQILLHYRTPTVGGSSGSPVFDREWKVMGLHHAGSENVPRLHGEGEYMANEGISFMAIRSYLDKFR